MSKFIILFYPKWGLNFVLFDSLFAQNIILPLPYA